MAQRSNNAISTFVGFHAHCVCICAQSVHMSKCAHISVLKCTNGTCVKMRNIQVFGLYKPYPLCYIYQTFIVDPLANMFSTYCSSPAITLGLGGSEPPSEVRWRVYCELFEGTDNSGDLLRSTQACFVIMTHQICTFSGTATEKHIHLYMFSYRPII